MRTDKNLSYLPAFTFFDHWLSYGKYNIHIRIVVRKAVYCIAHDFCITHSGYRKTRIAISDIIIQLTGSENAIDTTAAVFIDFLTFILLMRLLERCMPRADSERQQNNKSTAVHPLSCRFTFDNIYISWGMYTTKFKA